MISPMIAFLMGAGYVYIATNPKARAATINQVKKLSGMAIDGLNKKSPISTDIEQNNEKEDDLNAK